MAEYCRDLFQLEKMILVTSPNPPHRSVGLLDGAARHELVEAACRENPNFEASRIELDRQGPSYTVDTLRAFKKQFGDSTRLNLLIGQDNAPHLSSWHDYQDLLKLARLLVAPRNHEVTREEVAAELPSGAEFELARAPLIPVSGSEIRQRLLQGHSVMYMVTPQVNRLVLERGYFRP